MNQDEQVYEKIKDAIAPLNAEIAARNQYIQRRDDFIFGDSLMNSIEWLNGHDKTEYNWLYRVVDIHTSQLMGRDLSFYSTYDKRDLSMSKDIQDPQQADNDMLQNKRLKANADARRDLIQAIITDNGGSELFQVGAQSGSAFGFTVYKSWMSDDMDDADDKPWNIDVLENIQNYIAIWSSDNFRAKDADVYMDQISVVTANRLYGAYLDEGESFETSPIGTVGENPNPAPTLREEGTRDMVNRIEYTGYLAGVRGEGGDIYECDPGEETRVNLLVVGGKTVRIITEEDKLPRYWIIPNQRVMRRPWGAADVNDSAIEINRTYLERMSDWVTLGNKVLFPKWKALGFDISTVPRPKSRTAQMIPMDVDQDIRLIDTPTQFGYEFPKLIDQLTTDFVRTTRISRVLFDDPQAAASNSNQALTTSMKGTIDAVEKKQKIWQNVLVQMFDDALRTLARHHEDIASVVDPDENWSLYVKWPSVLRKEDPIYQQMLLNRFNAGTVSVDSFMEEQGVSDPGEEVDRIRDNMSDETTAAILGRQLPALAQKLIAPPADPNAPKQPEIKHTVNWRADMTPQQEANLATTIPGFQDGPFGMSMGPQGNQGLAAGENTDNKGFLDGNPFKGGEAINRGPDGKPLPTPAVPSGAPGVNSDGTSAPSQIQTSDMNSGTGVVSAPGSGATPVSPQGAIDKQNQNDGA